MMKKKSYIQSWPTILAISALIWSTFGVSSVSASLVNSSSSTDLLSTGLVGHWTFDGKKTPWTSSTAGTTLDSSGNSNTGTLTSMVQSTNPVAGRIGQALTFDGSTDYISAGVPSNLTFTAASTFSVSAWIKTTQSGINTCISGKYDSTVGKGYFWCSLSGNVYMQMQTSQTIYIYRIGSTAIANGVWHHVVATYSGTSNASTGIKLYVDGVIEPTYSDTQTVGTLGSLAVSSNYTIGRRGDLGSSPLYFNGTIDDHRVYDRVLSAAEIKRLYNIGNISKISVSSSTDLLSTGLVGHWTFDGKKTPWTSSTAGTALDSSGNSNTGTLTSMVQSTNPVAGRIGQALTFDGTNDWIQMSNESTFDFEKTTAFSVFAWVKTTASSDSFVVAKAQNSGTYTGWYIFVDNGAGSQGSTGTGQIAVDFNSGANLRRRYGTTVVKDGKWHHVGFVNDGLGVATSVKIYVDGTENSTATGTNSVPSSILTNVNVSVGSRDAGGVPYPGAIDDVRIFNRAVSTAEILRLYKMGSGLVVKNLDPYYNSVVLLLHMNGANGSTTFTDSSSSAHTVTSYLGTSTLSTALYKFATASGLMAGGHGLYLDGGTDFTYGTADFTIESWVRLTGGTGVEQNYYDGRDSFSAVMPRIYKSTSEKLIYFTAGAVKITGTTSLTQNVWYHVAVSRYNGSTKLFLDGVQEGSTYTDTNSYVTAASRPAIGVDGAFGGNYITGYLDDYRITKGVARYTTTFTPPAVEFGNVRR